MDAFVARTVERFGRLDVMICNAGFGIAGAIDDITPDQMQKLMDVNYIGTYLRRARGAAGLPPPGLAATSSSCRRSSASAACRTWARTRRRSSRRSASPSACAPSSPARGIHVSVVYPVSTETEFFDVMSRETGTTVDARARPAADASSVSPTRSRARSRARCPRSIRTRKSRALVLAQRARARLQRSRRASASDANRSGRDQR